MHAISRPHVNCLKFLIIFITDGFSLEHAQIGPLAVARANRPQYSTRLQYKPVYASMIIINFNYATPVKFFAARARIPF